MFTYWKSLTVLGKAVVLVVVLIAFLGAVKLMLWAIEDNARDAGEKTVIVETQKRVIEDVQAANEARQKNAERSDAEWLADCVRRARNPENCK